MKKRVFIVEDESLLALDVKKYLEQNDYVVVGLADRGEDAIGQLRESPADVVLMDIRIKGDMDGIETAGIIQAELGVPVIYVTAYTEDATLERAKQTSPYGFVVKPFSRRELITAIEMAVFKARMEKQLFESERRYRSLFNHSNDAIIITDMDGKIVETNIRAREVLGYDEEQFRLLHFLDLIDFSPTEWEEDAFHFDQMKAELNEQGTVNREIRLLTNKKKMIWVELRAAIVDTKTGWVQNIIRDVTQRKQEKNQLIRFSKAIEQSPSLVTILDHEGFIDYVNSTFVKVREYHYAEIFGKHFSDLIADKGELEIKQRAFQEALNGKVWQGEWPSRTKSGQVLYESVSLSPIKDSKGHITHVIRVGQDITERQKAELEKKALEKQLRHSQKLETIGRLAGGIAHDFNNILAPMAVYADMAMDDIPRDSQTWSDLNHVLLGVKRAKELVRQILKFSRQDEHDHKSLLLRVVVKEALNLIRASIPSTVTFELDIAKKTGYVMADPTQIHQVVMNLCTNSFQALPPGGGKIKVALKPLSVRKIKQDGFARLKPGSYVMLSVSDTGCGMERNVVEKAFEPFFTTKAVGKNSGLGLSVIHGIVKRHQGEITIESAPGQGTEVRIYFPSCPEGEDAPLNEERDIPGGHESILFVDDEEENMAMGQEMLGRLGYRVTVKSNGCDAWQAIKSEPEAFDLIITDQSMPGMTGLDLASRVDSLAHRVPVLLLTGFSEDLAPEQLNRASVAALVKKPMIRKEMAQLIRDILESGDENHAR